MPSYRLKRQTISDLKRQIQSLQEELARTAQAALDAELKLKAQKPIIDAALAWKAESPGQPISPPGRGLIEAVDNYRFDARRV